MAVQDDYYKGHHLEDMTKVYYGFVKCVGFWCWWCKSVDYEFVIAFPYMLKYGNLGTANQSA